MASPAGYPPPRCATLDVIAMRSGPRKGECQQQHTKQNGRRKSDYSPEDATHGHSYSLHIPRSLAARAAQAAEHAGSQFEDFLTRRVRYRSGVRHAGHGPGSTPTSGQRTASAMGIVPIPAQVRHARSTAESRRLPRRRSSDSPKPSSTFPSTKPSATIFPDREPMELALRDFGYAI
jgi:hypothetical protein